MTAHGWSTIKQPSGPMLAPQLRLPASRAVSPFFRGAAQPRPAVRAPKPAQPGAVLWTERPTPPWPPWMQHGQIGRHSGTPTYTYMHTHTHTYILYIQTRTNPHRTNTQALTHADPHPSTATSTNSQNPHLWTRFHADTPSLLACATYSDQPYTHKHTETDTTPVTHKQAP